MEEGVPYKRGRLGGFKISLFPDVNIDCFSALSFGSNFSIVQSFDFYNATINAAACKIDCPASFLSHPLFDQDAQARNLRILSKGFSLQAPEQRAKSLGNTLELGIRENLNLVLDESVREIIADLASIEKFRSVCDLLVLKLQKLGRETEANLVGSLTGT
jgi:hypothetical protein